MAYINTCIQVGHGSAKTYVIDLKLGEKLDINERNDLNPKKLTSNIMTSRDVTMTSSIISKIKTADFSTFLAPDTIDMYFF